MLQELGWKGSPDRAQPSSDLWGRCTQGAPVPVTSPAGGADSPSLKLVCDCCRPGYPSCLGSCQWGGHWSPWGSCFWRTTLWTDAACQLLPTSPSLRLTFVPRPPGDLNQLQLLSEQLGWGPRNLRAMQVWLGDLSNPHNPPICPHMCLVGSCSTPMGSWA